MITKTLAADVPKHAMLLPPGPRGLERADQEDLTLPRVLLMQGQSKLVQDKGKKVGSFVNSLSEESFDALNFIPVVFSKYYTGVKWDGTTRIFEFRTFDKSDPRLSDRLWFRDGDDRATAETTMSFISGPHEIMKATPRFGVGSPRSRLIDSGFIDFTGMSLDGGKKLVTLATLSKKDLWMNAYKLLSAKKTNKKGQVFFVKDVEPLGVDISQDATDQAEKLYASFGAKVEALNKDETQDA